MAIDKGLFEAPKKPTRSKMVVEPDAAALEVPLAEQKPPIEVKPTEDGGVEIDFDPAAMAMEVGDPNANLAELLEDDILDPLASDLIGDYQEYKSSRDDWEQSYIKGLDLLGFKYEDRTEPFQGASGATHPVLAEAVTQFQALAYKELLPANGPVRTRIMGKHTKEKEDQAERVKEFMNYQLMCEMPEYEPEFDQMLFNLPLAGSTFKKVYYDQAMGRCVSKFVPAEDLVVPYNSSSLDDAEAIIHVIKMNANELRKLQVGGFYKDVELGTPAYHEDEITEEKQDLGGVSTTNKDEIFTLLECHVDLDLDGFQDMGADGEPTGIKLPYIVTIEESSSEVLSIRKNFVEGDPLRKRKDYFVHFKFLPGLGFYGFGLIHMIGGLSRTATAALRQLLDAGTLSNLPAGFKMRGIRVRDEAQPLQPGEFRDVDAPGGDLNSAFMPLPYKEPSQVLLQLLKDITTEGRRLGAVSDMNISDMSANAPVGTTLALLERTLKPMAAVQARVHYAMKQEFKMLKMLMAEYATAEYTYVPTRGDVSAKQSDYMMIDVIPVSDPNSSTMAQRVVQYQAVLQMSQTAPQIYDLPQLHRQMIEVLGVKNAEKLVPTKDDLKPVDPVSENMAVLQGKPMKAFIYQDHDAHIATHTAFMQDPVIAQMIGQNPQAKQIMAGLQAHIAEHLGYKYRKDIEAKLGVELPLPNEQLPEEIEVNLSRVVADAAKQLTQQNVQQAAQQAAQQKAQDPVVQMQQAELQIKAQEVQRKAEKDKADIALQQAEQERKARVQHNTYSRPCETTTGR